MPDKKAFFKSEISSISVRHGLTYSSSFTEPCPKGLRKQPATQ